MNAIRIEGIAHYHHHLAIPSLSFCLPKNLSLLNSVPLESSSVIVHVTSTKVPPKVLEAIKCSDTRKARRRRVNHVALSQCRLWFICLCRFPLSNG
jgi:hypothetical protein